MHQDVAVVSHADIDCDRVIHQCDIFVLGGGGLLQDSTSIYNVFRWINKLKLAIKYHKKTYVYANSVGPLKYWVNRYVVKKYLKKVDRITLRDEISFQLLKSIGIEGNMTVTADPVFSYKVSEVKEKAIVDKYGLSNEYAAIAVRHWFDTIPFIPVSFCIKHGIRTSRNRLLYENYVNEIRKTVNFINNNLGIPVYFISFCFRRDAKVAQDILNTENLRKKNRIIDDEYITPEETMTIISKSRFLLGMRLHSIIYAINGETPVVPIIYEEKVQGLMGVTGLGKYAVRIEEISSKKISEKIELILSHGLQQKRIECEAKEKMQMKEKLNYEYMLKLI